MARFLSILLAALVLGPALGEAEPGAPVGLAGPGWPLPDDDELKGVRLDRPRAGPGATALLRLANCVGDDGDTAVCLGKRFPARDLAVRDLTRTTREASAGEGPGLVRYATEQLALGIEVRVKRLQRPAMRECALPLEAVLRGRCDDLGPVRGIQDARSALAGDERELLTPFLKKLPGIGKPTIHRLVCGPFALGGAVRIDEVLVVLGAGSPRPIEDLRCRMVPRPGPDAPSPPGGAWSIAREQTTAVRALSVGLDCLDAGGGACQEMVAPLTFLQLETLNRGLDHPDRRRQAAWLEQMRAKTLGHPSERRPWILEIAYKACPTFASLPPDEACVAGPTRRAKPPPLPRLKGGEGAQARALRAILEAQLRGLEPRQAPVQCGETSVLVTFASREDGSTALLGMVCALPL